MQVTLTEVSGVEFTILGLELNEGDCLAATWDDVVAEITDPQAFELWAEGEGYWEGEYPSVLSLATRFEEDVILAAEKGGA